MLLSFTRSVPAGVVHKDHRLANASSFNLVQEGYEVYTFYRLVYDVHRFNSSLLRNSEDEAYWRHLRIFCIDSVVHVLRTPLRHLKSAACEAELVTVHDALICSGCLVQFLGDFG